MDSMTQELNTLAESKAMYDKWLNELSRAESEPLVIEDGKIISGVMWIGLAPKAAKVRRKPATKASAVQAWAMKYASKSFSYAT